MTLILIVSSGHVRLNWLKYRLVEAYDLLNLLLLFGFFDLWLLALDQVFSVKLAHLLV